MRVTIRDYERIVLVLQTGGPWTIERLRDTLLALLTRNEDQQQVFLRHFNDFFRLHLVTEQAFAEIDVQRALEELRQLAQEHYPTPAPASLQRLHQPITRPLERPRFKLKWWTVLSIVLALGLLVAIGYAFRLLLFSPSSTVILSNRELKFGNQLVGDASTAEISLTNESSSTITVTSVITGPHASDFSLDADYASLSISAGDTLTITVCFAPTSEGDLDATLIIAPDGVDSPQYVALQGTGGVAEPTPDPLAERKRLYRDVPYVKDIEYVPISTNWQRLTAFAVFFLLAALGYAIYLWRSRKIPEDRAALWDKDKPRFFPLGSIGGEPAPRLCDETLNQLADCMGYFKSAQSSRVLNVLASIEATLRSGGIPMLEFHTRKRIRSLLILEDAFAEATAWNPIARELARGMRQRGVPVLFGRFNGSPGQFKTEDGSVYYLEDLEDHRRGYLLLIFTDGKGLYRHESTFALEALTRWPMVAWMDLREPRFWDETSVLPVRYGIPIYPATPAGTIKAVRRFLTERAAEPDFLQQARHWQDTPDEYTFKLEACINEFLGDALTWAQDCAMLQPVISLGLADALRRKFHPHLPAERTERLFALPGTQCNVSGLRFSDEALKVLRAGFLVRRGEQEQEEVLRFLLQEIEKSEPDEEGDSLAHLAWEFVRERVRLELDPDNDLARLAQLARTPLGNAVGASLEGFGFEGETDKIPLRLKPRSKHALQRLARISDGLKISKLEAYPVARWHWFALAIMILSFLGFTAWACAVYFGFSSTASSGMILKDTLYRLERRVGDTWSIEKASSVSLPITDLGLLAVGNYRLTVHNNTGHKGVDEFSVEETSAVFLTVETTDVEKKCHDEFPNVGLIVKRCPDSETTPTETAELISWLENLGEAAPKDRLMSVGLEIYGEGLLYAPYLPNWHNTLFQSGSIDVLYQIQLGSDGEWHIDEAVERLEADLGPMVGQSQLLWWEVGQRPEELAIENLFSGFDRVLQLSEGEDTSWITSLEKLFQPAADIAVTEQEILEALGRDSSDLPSSQNQIVLVRPSTTAYPPPTLVEAAIDDCNVTFRWEWSESLAADEWFAVRVGTAGTGDLSSVSWIRESMYVHILSEAGNYSWEIAVCRGVPGQQECSGDSELAVSEREDFGFLGCLLNPTATFSLMPTSTSSFDIEAAATAEAKATATAEAKATATAEAKATATAIAFYATVTAEAFLPTPMHTQTPTPAPWNPLIPIPQASSGYNPLEECIVTSCAPAPELYEPLYWDTYYVGDIIVLKWTWDYCLPGDWKFAINISTYDPPYSYQYINDLNWIDCNNGETTARYPIKVNADDYPFIEIPGLYHWNIMVARGTDEEWGWERLSEISETRGFAVHAR